MLAHNESDIKNWLNNAYIKSRQKRDFIFNIYSILTHKSIIFKY